MMLNVEDLLLKKLARKKTTKQNTRDSPPLQNQSINKNPEL